MLDDTATTSGPTRATPFRPVPAHDASLLRTLFRGARFPDTEWWWHTIHVNVRSSAGNRRELSIVTNVQLLAEPLRGEIPAAAVVAVRDVGTGERWVARSRGAMSSSRACRYSSPGWQMLRLDPAASTFNEDAIGLGLRSADRAACNASGAYGIELATDDFDLMLLLEQRKLGIFGANGWVDYNPSGALPLWASAKCRIARPSGSVRLPLSTGSHETYVVESGYAHFEQQCIVPTASTQPLVRLLADPRKVPAIVREAAAVRPRWHWFRADLGNDVHMSAYTMWNPRTGMPYRDFIALLDPRGQVIHPELVEFSTPHDDGRTIPSRASVRFEVRSGEHGIVPGRYAVTLQHRPEFDWSVPYLCPFGWVCRAHEAHCTVSVVRDSEMITEASSGAQETIDLVSSLERDDLS